MKDQFDLIIASPGRINLIGEHIDYNGGYVLPAAIDKKINLRFKKNNINICKVHSKNFNTYFEIDLDNIKRSEVQWHNYILGVMYHIDKLKPKYLKGFDCEIESNLPLGSGMSSSAALECGFAKGLNELFNIGFTDIDLITLSRDAEHTFVGTKCGIMDQFAVVKGEKDHLLLLNCETLLHQLIPADFGDYKIILLNTNVSHNLASSEYNLRRDECNAVMETINKKYPQYKLLAQVPFEVLEEFRNALPEVNYNRAHYVISENRRTLAAVETLKLNNLKQFGALLYKSHEGLSKKYEVSCDELDFLVDYTKDIDYVIGSRMMGGGFGGCTINLVHKEYVYSFIKNISEVYKRQFDVELTSIDVGISKGVSKIESE
ncbi:galactokinase [Flavobacteriaceae sp. LMIT009]